MCETERVETSQPREVQRAVFLGAAEGWKLYLQVPVAGLGGASRPVVEREREGFREFACQEL